MNVDNQEEILGEELDTTNQTYEENLAAIMLVGIKRNYEEKGV